MELERWIIKNKKLVAGIIVILLITLSGIGSYKNGLIYRYIFFVIGFLSCLGGFLSGHESEKDLEKYDKEVRMARQWTPLINQKYKDLESQSGWSYFLGVIGAIVMVIAGYYFIQNPWGIFSVISMAVGLVFLWYIS